MYIDLLTQILNAQRVLKERIKFPYSGMDEAVLKILKENNFVEDYEKKGRGVKKYFDIKIAYENNSGKIKGVKFVSKPSRRIYRGYRDIRKVRGGYGIAVISTSKGIVSDSEARKNKIGGEVLFEIW